MLGSPARQGHDAAPSPSHARRGRFQALRHVVLHLQRLDPVGERHPQPGERLSPARGVVGSSPSGAGGGMMWRACAPPAAIALSTAAQSATVRAMGPAWSRVAESGTMPSRSAPRPWVGLIELTPESAAGIRSEPAVSVPSAAGTMPAASAAPEPPLEPPALRETSHGLPTWSVV